MTNDLHPIHHYAQNIIRAYHDKLSARTVFDHHVSSHRAPPSRATEAAPESDFRVGIIGGGAGGLFAAMLLQHCGIRYEILERSGGVGGRLFTHHFSDEENDYFDVGAMRFPQSPIMEDIFKLFRKINITERIIPYHFNVDQNILYFNGVRRTRNDREIHQATTFGIRTIPEPYASIGWEDLSGYAVKPFKDALVKDAQEQTKSGWELLMRYDAYSARTYMEKFDLIVQSEEDKALLNPDGILPYPSVVLDWMELFSTSTNSYNTAFSEQVLDELAFSWPGSPPWFCVQGGVSKIADGMVAWLREKSQDPTAHIVKNAPVTAISQNADAPTNSKMEVKYGDGRKASYAHVITTTALPCLRAVDLSKAQLTFPQQTAIRSLNYGPATKIGVKFKTAWWTDPAIMKQYGNREAIQGGQSITDSMSRVVVYPSYGQFDRSHVLLASYAWTSDAQALGALISRPEAAQELKRIVLRDLVDVHGFNEAGAAFLESEWVDAFSHSWMTDPRTMGGAYAQFNSGQFSQLYPALTMPSAGQRLWFAGEVISSEHAWVCGALGASARAVKGLILCAFGPDSEEMKKFHTFWDDVEVGKPDEGGEKRKAPAQWEPQGWTIDLLVKQLAASGLPSDVLIDNELAFKV